MEERDVRQLVKEQHDRLGVQVLIAIAVSLACIYLF